MFNFVIILKEPALTFSLAFKTLEAAKVALEKVKSFDKDDSTLLLIKDDYGHELQVYPYNVAGVLIQNHQSYIERNMEQDVDVARANASFVKKRETDMELMRLFPPNQIVPTGRKQ